MSGYLLSGVSRLVRLFIGTKQLCVCGRWLGPLSRATCNGLIDAAFLKLTVADDMIENQSHRVDIEDRTRSNATTNLCGQLRRFASIKALADMNQIAASSPSATQAIRSAEHALKSVKRTNGSGTVEAAMRGLMTATSKVSRAPVLLLHIAFELPRTKPYLLSCYCS